MTRPSRKSKPLTKWLVAALDRQIGNQDCVKTPPSPSNGTAFPSDRVASAAEGTAGISCCCAVIYFLLCGTYRPYRAPGISTRSEEHTSELQSLMRLSYAVLCLKKKSRHKH